MQQKYIFRNQEFESPRQQPETGKLTRLHSHLERLFADVLMDVRLLVKVGQSAFRKSERGHKAVMYVILHHYPCEHSCESQPPIDTTQHSRTALFDSEPPRCKRFPFIKKYIYWLFFKILTSCRSEEVNFSVSSGTLNFIHSSSGFSSKQRANIIQRSCN